MELSQNDITLILLLCSYHSPGTRQCVCKQWRDIVDDPSFVDSHQNSSWIRPGGGRILVSFSNFGGSKHYFYSAGLQGGEAVRLLSLSGCNKGCDGKSPCRCYVFESLNGVVCLYNGTNVHVFNPSTQNIRTLPESPESQRYSKLNSFIRIPYSSYSFGLDPLTNEYKVLHVRALRQKMGMKLEEIHCEVFTIKPNSRKSEYSSSWRKITHLPPYPYMFKEKSVCVNGAIHWIGMRSPGDEVLVAFQVGAEKFHLIPLPDFIPSNSSLTNIGGRLALFGYKDGTASAWSIELWVLDDYQNLLWKKECIEGPQNSRRPKTLISVGNIYSGEILLTSSMFSHHYDVIPRHQAKNRTIRVGGLPAWTDMHGAQNINFRITNHVESFMLPNHQMIIRFGDFVVPLGD